MFNDMDINDFTLTISSQNAQAPVAGPSTSQPYHHEYIFRSRGLSRMLMISRFVIVLRVILINIMILMTPSRIRESSMISEQENIHMKDPSGSESESYIKNPVTGNYVCKKNGCIDEHPRKPNMIRHRESTSLKLVTYHANLLFVYLPLYLVSMTDSDIVIRMSIVAHKADASSVLGM
jgi:hypothetical protein